MELVDGETLAQRLNRGPLHVPDALELARQIAEAREAAHEKDIIHRDLLWQISTAGGSMPRWRGDGGEIYYRAGDGTLMAVAIHASAASFDHGTSQALFAGIRSSGDRPSITYEPAVDGQRFLVNLRSSEAEQSPITVVLNWQNAIGR